MLARASDMFAVLQECMWGLLSFCKDSFVFWIGLMKHRCFFFEIVYFASLLPRRQRKMQFLARRPVDGGSHPPILGALGFSSLGCWGEGLWGRGLPFLH